MGTATGTIFAPPYACLSMGFLEETKLYPQLRQHFNEDTANHIIELYFRFMDDGIVPLPKRIVETFKDILQNLDENI